MGNLQSESTKTKSGTKSSKGLIKKFTTAAMKTKQHNSNSKLNEDHFTAAASAVNAELEPERSTHSHSTVIVDVADVIVSVVNEQKHSESSPSSDSFTTTGPLLTPPVECSFTAEFNQCYYNTSEENVNVNVNQRSDKIRVALIEKLSRLSVSKTKQEFYVDVLDVEEEMDRPRKIELVSTRIIPASGTFHTDLPIYERHFSIDDTTNLSERIVKKEEPVVLRKVSSLILDRNNDMNYYINKPKFVPEKLDFKIYEKFEGHMLANWFLSEFDENHCLRKLLNQQDLRLLVTQFCTHLLAAGVLCQIPDQNVQLESIFKMDLMYYWAHLEQPECLPQTPGRLSTLSWPPLVSSPTTSEVFESPCWNNDSINLMNNDNHRINNNNNNNDKLPPIQNDNKINELNEKIASLQYELETLKTLTNIQMLTENVIKEFDDDNDLKEKENNKKEFNSIQNKEENINSSNSSSSVLELKLSSSPEISTSTHSIIPPPPPMPLEIPSTPLSRTDFISFSMSGAVPPPPPMPETVLAQHTITETVPLPPPMPTAGPSIPSAGPPPPPILSAGPPPPPPILSAGPPPPPMPCLGPPSPPMPCLGPPPPPMPGIGPPPPPMPGLGPPPPPMPGLKPPPPPPMTGSGLPPPPPPLSNQCGPIPFPAPIAGGWNYQRSTMRKAPVNPPIPMKPLYWTRIIIPTTTPSTTIERPPETSSSTTEDNNTETQSSPLAPLWLELEETKIENLSEFAELFSRQVIVRKATKKKSEKHPKHEVAKILDNKRSQNVGILAQSLHVEFTEIENAIYNFDTSVVSLEVLEQIFEVLANNEELAQIKEHLKLKPDIPLDRPEQFLYDLSEISNFAARISCFMFQTEFEDSISTTDGTLANLKSTCEFLMNNKNLKDILSLILTLGNYMNGGNMQRGQADGFGLEILAKLKDVKSKDNQITLLHFIVRNTMNRYQGTELLNLTLPVPEPGDIDRAATVNFDDVEKDLQRIQKRLNDCEIESKKVINESTTDNIEPFRTKMLAFIANAKEQVSTEFKMLTECRVQYTNTMKLYDFKPKTGTLEIFPPNEFFAFWSQFCVDFKDLWKKEEQRLINEKVKELKRKQEVNIPKIKKREGGLKAKIERLRAMKNL